MLTIEDLPFDIIYYICRNFLKEHSEIKKLRLLNKYFKKITPFKSISILTITKKTNYLYKLNFDCLTDLTCNGLDIEYIYYPPNIKNLDCSNNKIRTIRNLPNSIKNLKCSNNNIYIFEIPYGIETIDCSNNKLRWLRHLPTSIKQFNCSSNLLEVMVIPFGITNVDCSNNKLTELCIPESICGLNCSFNKTLNRIKINHKLKHLYCYKTNIDISYSILYSE